MVIYTRVLDIPSYPSQYRFPLAANKIRFVLYPIAEIQGEEKKTFLLDGGKNRPMYPFSFQPEVSRVTHLCNAHVQINVRDSSLLETRYRHLILFTTCLSSVHASPADKHILQGDDK